MPRGFSLSVVITFVISVFTSVASAELKFNLENCSPQKESDEVLYSGEYHWNMSHGEMLDIFNRIYQSKKRMPFRAYIEKDTGNIRFPLKHSPDGDVTVPAHFIESVVTHIEVGLKQGVVEAVFFPDMGHSHYFIPLENYTAHDAKYGAGNSRKFLEAILADTELKILYHTAEQLKYIDEDKRLIDDPHLKFRAHTRNLVGQTNGSSEVEFLQNPKSVANTAGELPGYHYWGGGFSMNSNQNGCFQYTHNGQDYYFDISLYDLEPAPGTFWD